MWSLRFKATTKSKPGATRLNKKETNEKFYDNSK